MIDGALPYLRCPVCEQSLTRSAATLRCPAGHSFDLARQGYANLAGRTRYDGDTAGMVADRDAFLAAGYYDFIADALTGQSDHGLILDAGTGTGYYLARVLDKAAEAIGIGIDVSKAALRRAARAHPRAAAVLADLWRPLPIADGTAALLLNVFAPRNGAEFHRVLRPDGVLLVVTPASDHLTELVEEHGMIHVDPDKAARVEESLGDHFTAIESRELRRTLELTGPQVRTLIGMTPSAHHVQAGAEEDGTSTVTAAVTVTAYGKKS